MKNNLKLLIVCIVGLVFVLSLGVSFAYFTARINGAELSTTISADAGSMEIVFADNSSTVTGNLMAPSTTAFANKKFNLTGNNTTTKAMGYEIHLIIDSNGFSSSAISYTIESTNASNNGSSAVNFTTPIGIDSNDIIIGNGYFNNSNGDIHGYEVKFYFLDNGDDQTGEMDKSFNAHIEIESIPSNDLITMTLEGRNVKFNSSSTITFVKGSNVILNIEPYATEPGGIEVTEIFSPSYNTCTNYSYKNGKYILNNVQSSDRTCIIAFQGNACFVTGTKVLTDNGYVSIENIKVGDMVYSYNEKTNENELKEVIKYYPSQTKLLYEIQTEDGRIVKATSKHQFYIVDKGLVKASDLNSGDKIVTKEADSSVTITSVTAQEFDNYVDTYNFEVQDNHNYYVSESNYLVHNKGSLDS